MDGCGDLCNDKSKTNESTTICVVEGTGISLQLNIWREEAVLKCADTDFVTLAITRKEEFFNVAIAVEQLAFQLSMYNVHFGGLRTVCYIGFNPCSH